MHRSAILLLATALAQTIAALPQKTLSAGLHPSPGSVVNRIAPMPTLAPRIPAASAASTPYPVTVTNCFNFADPDEGAASGCQCENWNNILPYLSGPSSCGYSVISSFIPPPTTSNTFDTTEAYPYTMTLPNGGKIAYASSSPVADPGPWQPWSGAGSATTIQIGTSLGMQVATHLSAQSIGTLTGGQLFSAVSNAIVTACPSPPPGSTVQACATPSPIKNIPYLAGSEMNYDGELTLSIPFAAYSDAGTLAAMIASVATAMNVSSLAPQNTELVSYQDVCYNCADIDPTTHYMNLTKIPAAVQATILIQDESTNGAVQNNHLQLQAEFHVDSFDKIFCSVAAFAGDSLGLLAIIPGLDFLAIGVAPAAFAFSFDCLMEE